MFVYVYLIEINVLIWFWSFIKTISASNGKFQKVSFQKSDKQSLSNSTSYCQILEIVQKKLIRQIFSFLSLFLISADNGNSLRK